MADIQFAPDGTLYGFSTSASASPTLYTINPQTATATPVGPLGSLFVFEGGLAFAPDGTAYGVNGNNATAGQLFTLNLQTGAATVIATYSGTNPAYDINGLVYRSDGMLVGLEDFSNSLIVLNPVTGAITTLAALPFVVGPVGGMTELNGRAYLATGAGGSDSLYTANLFTGARSLVGVFSPGFPGSGLSGIAGEPASSVPEPSAYNLLALGLPCLAAAFRRK